MTVADPPAPPVPPAPPALDAAALPGESFALHPRLRQLWRWQAAITAVAASLIACGWLLVAGHWLLLPAVPVLAVVLSWLSLRHADAWLQRFHCLLLPDGLLIRRGVWWRNEIFVPRARIQHTEVHEGPLLRRFGMATLKVFTAGTRLAELEVEGLPRPAALALRDRLLDRHGHDAL